MRLIDSHCHLDAPGFDADRAAVIARAHEAGVIAQVIPAVSAANWPALRHVCTLAPALHAAYGLHPMYLARHRPGHLDELRTWIEREQPVAVGECGLDFFVDDFDAEGQRFYFDAQLRLARDFDLPVIVHARRAVDAVIASIRRIGVKHGVVHSFSGSPEQAAQLFKLGFMIGLGGPVTYERAQRLHRLAAAVPVEHLLLETDAPDQPDSGIRGLRNEPARLPVVCETIAQLRGMPAQALAKQTRRNAERMFRLPASA